MTTLAVMGSGEMETCAAGELTDVTLGITDDTVETPVRATWFIETGPESTRQFSQGTIHEASPQRIRLPATRRDGGPC